MAGVSTSRAVAATVKAMRALLFAVVTAFFLVLLAGCDGLEEIGLDELLKSDCEKAAELSCGDGEWVDYLNLLTGEFDRFSSERKCLAYFMVECAKGAD